MRKIKENKVEKPAHSGWFSMVGHDFHENKELYIMFLPVLLYFIVFKYLPMYGAVIAFKDFSPKLGILGSPWAGLKHFTTFLKSPSFMQLIVNTLRISLTSIIFGFPAPIILALLVNELKLKKFSKVVQNITYLPHFVSLVVICGMIRTFTMDTGVIGTIAGALGMEPKTLLNYPKYFVPVYVISGIWQSVGWDSIIYMAALSGIDSQLYEAAMMDGAGRFKMVLHVTIPGIAPTIIIMLLLRMGGILGVGYEKIILLYNDITMEVADVISTYVYRKGLIDLNWSFSTAVGLLNSVINFVFLITANKISQRVNEISLW